MCADMNYSVIAKWLSYGLKEVLVPLIQIVSPFIAAQMVLLSINRNHKNNITLQGGKTKDELKSKLYDELDEKLESANDAIHEAVGYVDKIFFSLASQQNAIAAGYQPASLNEHPLEINALQSKAANGLVKLIYVIEKYEIVSPELKIFQKALNVVAYDMRNAFASFFDESIHILPGTIERETNGVVERIYIPKPIFPKERIEHYKRLGSIYQEKLRDVFDVTHDFRIEIQNLLLGNLFDRTVPSRQPIDPSIKVIKTDAASLVVLDKHFEENTEWGKNKKEVERHVRESFNLITPS